MRKKMSIIKKIKNKLFSPNSEEYISELKEKGVKIGKGTIIWDPSSTVIDESRPWLLTIGEYVKITAGVVILCHDYSLSVMRRVYGEWIGEGQETVIGDNCFIGMNSTILMGTHIGNNVIVGAGSVVRGTVPDNVVVAGNPAKIICTLEEHYQNRKRKTAQEAIDCAQAYYRFYHKAPKPSDLSGFKFLFIPRDKKIVEEYGLNFYCNGDEPSEVEEAFYNCEPLWENYELFLRDAGITK